MSKTMGQHPSHGASHRHAYRSDTWASRVIHRHIPSSETPIRVAPCRRSSFPPASASLLPCSLQCPHRAPRRRTPPGTVFASIHLLLLLAPLSLLPPARIVSAQTRADLLTNLPGRPKVVPSFSQSAGYVPVDSRKFFFYWLAEAIGQPDAKPLVLWLNGGPGCSSVGCGFFEEIGPWRVTNKNGNTLAYNKHAWNRIANLLFLESPVGVGFSYSSNYSDYTTGDTQTAEDNFNFLVGFVQRHPRFAGRSLFIAGESYAGHYIPQLASLILRRSGDGAGALNLLLEGVLLGNPYVNYAYDTKGPVQFFYDHGMLSTEAYSDAVKCDFSFGSSDSVCASSINTALGPWQEQVDPYNIYGSFCRAVGYGYSRLSTFARLHPRLRMAVGREEPPLSLAMKASKTNVASSMSTSKWRSATSARAATSARSAQSAASLSSSSSSSPLRLNLSSVDPLDSPACMDLWVTKYLRQLAVQRAIRVAGAKQTTPMQWSLCSNLISYYDADIGADVIPTIKELLDSPLRVWIFSGDADSVVPFTGTREWINALGLETIRPLHPWFLPSGQVAGWTAVYDKLLWATVRGGAHAVPQNRPEEAFVLFRQFLLGESLPEAT